MKLGPATKIDKKYINYLIPATLNLNRNVAKNADKFIYSVILAVILFTTFFLCTTLGKYHSKPYPKIN